MDDDPFCMKHGVPYDAFDGCWRCTGEARDREDEKRRTKDDKDAEIDRLTAENAKLRESMPSEEVASTLRRVLSAHIGANAVSLQDAHMRERLSDPCGCSVDYARERLRQTEEALAWLARLDAARGGSYG